MPVQGLSVMYEAGGLVAEARWPTRSGRSAVETVLRVTDKGRDGIVVVPATRLNVLSASARTGLLRGMAQGDTRDAMQRLLDAICDDLWNLYREQRPTSRPDPDKATGVIDWMLRPIWPATATGLAATPSSFKSWGGMAIALSCATGEPVLTRNTTPPAEPFDVLYLDWEADPKTFASRLRNLCFGAGLELRPWIPYREMRTPLADAAEDLADEIADAGYRGVIVDSLSAGIGGSLVDDALANLFWDAIRVLGVPAFVIAHKSAQAGRQRETRMFGSVMHEARVRVAWNAERESESGQVRWECFKDNATGRAGKRLAWDWRFDHGTDDGPDVLMAVTAEGINPNDVNLEARPEGEDITRQQGRVLVALQNGPLLAGEVASRIGCSANAARVQLGRLEDKGYVGHKSDGRWERHAQA